MSITMRSRTAILDPGQLHLTAPGPTSYGQAPKVPRFGRYGQGALTDAAMRARHRNCARHGPFNWVEALVVIVRMRANASPMNLSGSMRGWIGMTTIATKF